MFGVGRGRRTVDPRALGAPTWPRLRNVHGQHGRGTERDAVQLVRNPKEQELTFEYIPTLASLLREDSIRAIRLQLAKRLHASQRGS